VPLAFRAGSGIQRVVAAVDSARATAGRPARRHRLLRWITIVLVLYAATMAVVAWRHLLAFLSVDERDPAMDSREYPIECLAQRGNGRSELRR
jgi:hypothetical protein